MGHECKENSDANHHHQGSKKREDGKINGEKKIWIPKTLASIIQGFTNIDELRTKMN